MLDVLDPQRQADADAKWTVVIDVHRGELWSDDALACCLVGWFVVTIRVDDVDGYWTKGVRVRYLMTPPVQRTAAHDKRPAAAGKHTTSLLTEGPWRMARPPWLSTETAKTKTTTTGSIALPALAAVGY